MPADISLGSSTPTARQGTQAETDREPSVRPLLIASVAKVVMSVGYALLEDDAPLTVAVQEQLRWTTFGKNAGYVRPKAP